MNTPWFLFLMTGAGLYVAKLWNDDRRTPHDRGLPGASNTTSLAVLIAVIGAVLILAGETYGENALGVAGEQTKITWLFALYSIVGAPIIEETIFRGYLVVTGKGRGVLWLAAVGVSLAFALLHPFLWRWDDSGFALTLSLKGWFTTATLFVSSLWFYAARFGPWNPTRSLLPAFAAHAAKNAGVVAVKAAMGYMGGLW